MFIPDYGKKYLLVELDEENPDIGYAMETRINIVTVSRSPRVLPFYYEEGIEQNVIINTTVKIESVSINAQVKRIRFFEEEKVPQSNETRQLRKIDLCDGK